MRFPSTLSAAVPAASSLLAGCGGGGEGFVGTAERAVTVEHDVHVHGYDTTHIEVLH